MKPRLYRGMVGAGVAALIALGFLVTDRKAKPAAPDSTTGFRPAAVDKSPSSSSYPSESLPAQVTWSEHIARIIHNNCTGCHRVGSAGPFPLLTYRDVADRADLIRYVTATRYMPPWPADPSYRHFTGEHVLSDKQIALIRRWVDQGTPPGDRRRSPKPPRFPAGSQLGKPDLVVRMPSPYTIRGDTADKFVSMRLPFSVPRDTFLRAVEFVPGNRKLVHHVNAHLLTFRGNGPDHLLRGPWFSEAGEHNMDPLEELGIRNLDSSSASLTLSVTNYLPGTQPTLYPEGIGGFRLGKLGYLLLHHIHYGPTPVDQQDSSYFNVFFAKRPPARPTFTLLLGTLGRAPVIPPLIIPPNSVKTFRTQYTLPVDLSVLTINPHMHLLGKTFLAYAVSPAGDTMPLIRIPRWDFRWQYFYTFEKILKLPRGTTIYAEATFDNTTANPNNPFRPPREVREQGASMRSTDEMFQCIITMMPYRVGDDTIRLDRGGINGGQH